MAIGNGELMQECFPKHSRMGTARLKYDNGTDEDDKKRGLSYKKKVQRAQTKSPDSLLLPNQNTILINIQCYYFTRYGKNTMKFN